MPIISNVALEFSKSTPESQYLQLNLALVGDNGGKIDDSPTAIMQSTHLIFRKQKKMLS